MTLEPGQSTLLSLNGHLRATRHRPRPKPAVHLPTIRGARRITGGVNERYVVDLFEESRRRFAEGITEELEDEDGILLVSDIVDFPTRHATLTRLLGVATRRGSWRAYSACLFSKAFGEPTRRTEYYSLVAAQLHE